MTDRVHAEQAQAELRAAAPRARAGADRGPLAELQRTAGNRAVQRLVSDQPDELDGEAVSARIRAAEPGGRELDSAVHAQVTDALGADPGPVRVHTDGEADALSQALGARAFTSGRDVFFRDGAYDPGSAEGLGLLVHESTHVMQQAAGPVPGTPSADGALSISDPGDAFEQAASANAAVLPASAPGGEGRPVQREDVPDEDEPG